MRRVDTAHPAPGLRGEVEPSPEAAIARLHELLREPELSLSELAELVDSSTVLRRAVMKGVTSVEVGWSQPVEGTLHAAGDTGAASPATDGDSTGRRSSGRRSRRDGR